MISTCATNTALKQQLLSPCPIVFLESLQHATLGFAHVTTLAMLTHLWAAYGIITPANIMADNHMLTSTWWHPLGTH
jgi:hypothetical protein